MGINLDPNNVFDDLCEHSEHSAYVLGIELALVALCLGVALLF